MTVMYPRLLDQNMALIRRIEPVSGSLDLNLDPLSGAELELKPGDSIPERSWVAMYTEHGLAGIFRSKPQRDRYGERSTSVSLVHGATELNDYLTGKSDQAQAAANTVISTIFSAYNGTHWVLGTVSPTASVVYSLNNSGVLDALVDIMEQLPGYMITFDQSVHPWRLNIVQRPSEVTAQGRLSRNIQSVEISRDDSSLCTRVYYGDGSSYVQDSTAVARYGVIEHRISDSSLTTAQLQTMANLYLDSHKAPKLSVTISAVDLSRITGEPLDQITLGSRYRLAIPDAETEENQVIEQIVCAVRYNDLFGDPNPQITLASDPETIVTFLKRQRRSGGAARQIAEEEAERQYQHWVTENEVYKESVYKIIGVQFDEHFNPVYKTDPVTGDVIVDDAGNPIPVFTPESDGSISSQVLESAQLLSQKVTYTDLNRTLGSYLTQTAWETRMGNYLVTKDGEKVMKSIAEVVTMINEQNEGIVRINGDRVYIDSAKSTTVGSALDIYNGSLWAKVQSVFGTPGNFVTINNGAVKAPTIQVNSGGSLVFGGSQSEQSPSAPLSLSRSDMAGVIKSVNLTGPVNDVYTLTATCLDGTTVQIGNFNRAATSDTNLSGLWSSGRFTVTAAPQNKDFWTDISQGTPSWEGLTVTIPIMAVDKDNQNYPYSTGRNVVLNVSSHASDIYEEGQKDVAPTITPAGWRWHEVSGDTVLDNTVTASNPYNTSNDQSTVVALPSLSVNVTKTQAVVSASDGTVSYPVATANHTQYADGQDSVVPTFGSYIGTPGSTPEELLPGTYEFKIVKDGTTTTDQFYTVPSAPAPADPKVSKGTWSNGQITFTAGTTGKSSDTVKIFSGTQLGTLNQAGDLISFNVYEQLSGDSEQATGATISAAIAKGTATPATPVWQGDSTHKYNISATGSFTVGGQTIQQNTGSISGGFEPTDAINYGKNLAKGISSLTFTQTSAPSYAQATTVDEIPVVGNGYYFVTATPVMGDAVRKKFHTPASGGSDRWARYTEDITLTADDIGESTWMKFATYNTGEPETDASKKTSITVDASAVYARGVDDGAGGTIDVVKEGWTRNTCLFSPSGGSGESASVTINVRGTVKSDSEATTRCSIGAYDGDQYIANSSDILTLARGTSTYNNYIYLCRGYQFSSASILAKIAYNGEPGSESRVVTFLSPIKLTPSDISTSTQLTNATFDENDPQYEIPISIDASDVYDQGVADGARIQIEQLRVVSQPLTQNRTYTLYPSDHKNVMAGIRFSVDVPPVYRRAEGLAETITLPASHKGTATITGNQVEYNEGPDTGNFPVVIDASNVYLAGVQDGSDLEIDQNAKVTYTSNGVKTLYPSGTYGAISKATITVNVPQKSIQDDRSVYYTTNGTYTIKPSGSFDGMSVVEVTVNTPSATYPTITHNVYSGTKTGQDVIGAVTVSSNRYIAITATSGGKTTTKYINLSKG